MNASGKVTKPLVEYLPYQSPIVMANYFRDEQGVTLLHSAKQNPQNGRFSYLGVRPFQQLVCKNAWIKTNDAHFKGDPLEAINKLCFGHAFDKHLNLPPFQGGAMGYLSYDLGAYFEQLPQPRKDEFTLPDIILGFYDVVFVWDHEQKICALLSSGLPQQGTHRISYAKQRLSELLTFINSHPVEPVIPDSITATKEITANFTRAEYVKALQKTIDYIFAGDIFEANISQRFHFQTASSAFDLYLKLQSVNPAPFAGFMQFPACQLISSSPERFLKLDNTNIEACPIKGTRPRGQTPEEDKQLGEELVNSVKDRAENIMIVDLMRNDLSKVCLPHSIKVPEVCGLHSFATVHHLISMVKGELAPEYNAIDVIRATFPGGSITGAPKIRAMEIIAEIEPTARGPYCGSMGYIGFDGDMDLSILIRTMVKKGDDVTFQAGGAIVSDSIPEEEYQETLDKAKGLIKVFGS